MPLEHKLTSYPLTFRVSRKSPRARKGRTNRVPFTARIDTATMKQVKLWQKAKVSKGLLLDRLTAHALRTGFNPSTDCF